MTTWQHAQIDQSLSEQTTSASSSTQETSTIQLPRDVTESREAAASADVSVRQQNTPAQKTKPCDHEGVTRPKPKDIECARKLASLRTKHRAKYQFEDSDDEDDTTDNGNDVDATQHGIGTLSSRNLGNVPTRQVYNTCHGYGPSMFSKDSKDDRIAVNRARLDRIR